jgi:hypothetical protein
MSRLQLYRLLRRNDKIASRRSPAFEQSIVAKVMMLFSAGFTIIYLIAFGVMMSVIANKEDMPALILVILPFFLLFDFGTRFIFQQTPLIHAKPYFLLPFPRRSVIEYFLLSGLFSGWNALWLSLFTPYSIIIGAGGSPWGTTLLVVLNGMLLVLANSQWYLLVRTLIGRSLLWWLLPLAVYALYFLPLFLSDRYDFIGDAFDFLGEQGASVWATIAVMLLLSLLFIVNRWLQFRLVYEEVSQTQPTKQKEGKVREFTFLNRFHITGEYLKLEVKSIMRNRAVRSKVQMSMALVVFLSAIISLTDIYDGFMLLNFWCYYCFGLFGISSLVMIMGPEGNYIDLLMTQRRTILQLLKAKYYFHCAILLVPFLVMMPAVLYGKFTWLMMLAYMLMSSGVLYFILFQLAVYNKQTLPLNQKLSGKVKLENGVQLLIEMVGMFLPVGLASILLLCFEETTAYLVMIVIGLLFTAVHPLWLRQVYYRMMQRKYENLEGFHASQS